MLLFSDSVVQHSTNIQIISIHKNIGNLKCLSISVLVLDTITENNDSFLYKETIILTIRPHQKSKFMGSHAETVFKNMALYFSLNCLRNFKKGMLPAYFSSSVDTFTQYKFQ